LVRPPARSSRPSPPSSGIRARVDVREHGVTIIGSAKAVEDFLDGREIDRRLADPESSRCIPWAKVKANLGL